MKEKNIFTKLWDKIKAWAKLTALPWLKKSWMQIVNIIVVFVAWDKLSDIGIFPGAETLVGLWGFLLLGYYIFWKLFGMDKTFKKFIEQNKKKKEPKPQPAPVKPVKPVNPVTPIEPMIRDIEGEEPKPKKEGDMHIVETKKPTPKKKK